MIGPSNNSGGAQGPSIMEANFPLPELARLQNQRQTLGPEWFHPGEPLAVRHSYFDHLLLAHSEHMCVRSRGGEALINAPRHFDHWPPHHLIRKNRCPCQAQCSMRSTGALSYTKSKRPWLLDHTLPQDSVVKGCRACRGTDSVPRRVF